ncbi:hypothetical protein [Mesorhizobium sp. B1-1-4]|uniref:hypothetical protein n=1 Tax=Mesorhizobium sp. B1-1-4 TaxID=2589980 RepID=UPI001FEE3822|nr:hypothetical protein [Mesorhizobium sp. B1-1-4]
MNATHLEVTPGGAERRQAAQFGELRDPLFEGYIAAVLTQHRCAGRSVHATEPGRGRNIEAQQERICADVERVSKRAVHAASSWAGAAVTSGACAKSLAVTWPPVARSIAATESQDGLDIPRLIRLICDWDMPTVAANASSVISWSERYWASFMSLKMHAMHMHVKHDYACHAILSKRAGE